MDNLNNNSLHISKDVFCSIVEIAINETEGAQVQEASFTDKFKKNAPINIDIQDNSLIIDAAICVNYGQEIPQLSSKIQSSVISAIEDMTSYQVKKVNLYIDNLKYSIQ